MQERFPFQMFGKQSKARTRLKPVYQPLTSSVRGFDTTTINQGRGQFSND